MAPDITEVDGKDTQYEYDINKEEPQYYTAHEDVYEDAEQINQQYEQEEHGDNETHKRNYTYANIKLPQDDTNETSTRI